MTKSRAGKSSVHPTVFIGSSAEGLDEARALQASLSHDCEPQVWTDGIMTEGTTAISSLLRASQDFDFAALVFTPDDEIVRRGKAGVTPRDNVILELGLFLGSLGPERVLVFRPTGDGLVMPSDWWGIIDCQYNPDPRNLVAAMSTAAKPLRERIDRLGVRAVTDEALPPVSSATTDHEKELEHDLKAIEKAAQAQGWNVQARDASIFRLVDRSGAKYPLTLTGSALSDRERLRSEFVPLLIAGGLRVSLRVQAPVGADLREWRPSSVAMPVKRERPRPRPRTKAKRSASRKRR
jgi:hypothetical protein